MHIAILGANSHIGQDLTISLGSLPSSTRLSLFSRSPLELAYSLSEKRLSVDWKCLSYSDFYEDKSYDAIINFVGVGSPAKAIKLGADILDITLEFDTLALNYVRKRPKTKYIFASSGAVYGLDFGEPATKMKPSSFDINRLSPHDWYGISKFHVETRHRTYIDLPLVDIRIFSYFSYTSDIDSGFLLGDILKSIKHKKVFRTSSQNIVRDFAGPQEISSLVQNILYGAPANLAIDCFTQSPIDKMSLLELMRSEFSLEFELVRNPPGLNFSQTRVNYFSKNKDATEIFGYKPANKSADVVINQIKKMFS